MNGKGSRQRTYGKTFDDNYDRIFRKNKEGCSPAGEEAAAGAPESASKADQKRTPCWPIGHEAGMSTSCLECEECTK